MGHCNCATDIKEVTFLGSNDELVACSSDDGCVFIYDAVGSLSSSIPAEKHVARGRQYLAARSCDDTQDGSITQRCLLSDPSSSCVLIWWQMLQCYFDPHTTVIRAVVMCSQVSSDVVRVLKADEDVVNCIQVRCLLLCPLRAAHVSVIIKGTGCLVCRALASSKMRHSRLGRAQSDSQTVVT